MVRLFILLLGISGINDILTGVNDIGSVPQFFLACLRMFLAGMALWTHYKVVTTDPGGMVHLDADKRRWKPPQSQPVVSGGPSCTNAAQRQPTPPAFIAMPKYACGRKDFFGLKNFDPIQNVGTFEDQNFGTAEAAENFQLIPIPQSEQQDLTYCKKCQQFKAPNVRHCRVCDRCVAKYDHHCECIGNCQGAGNTAFFFQFGFYILTLLSTVFLDLSLLILTRFAETKKAESIFALIFVVLVGLCFLAGLAPFFVRTFGYQMEGTSPATENRKTVDPDNATIRFGAKRSFSQVFLNLKFNFKHVFNCWGASVSRASDILNF